MRRALAITVKLCALAGRKRTDEGQTVHSFRTLLADLATLTRNTVRCGKAAQDGAA